MSVYLVFPDQAAADAVLREVAATPDLEGGVGPVWVWYDPDADTNVVSYDESPEGRCMIAHPWSDVGRDWWQAYVGAAWPAVQVLSAPPKDWQP